MATKTYHLSNLITLEKHMQILIDENVSQDDNGNFMVNVGYIRVSTDRQAEQGFGLDIQSRDIMNYCVRNNFTNLLLFVDDGYTGTNMDRPALQSIVQMIEDFNDGKSNLRVVSMIIPRVDRLGRTLLGSLQFIQDYIVAKSDSKNSSINRNKEDINFVSVAENFVRVDKTNPQAKLMLMFMATLAEYDRDMIVEKMQKGKTERIAAGYWMGGGNVPYGYRYDRDKGILIVVPEEADKIKEIFRLYIEEKLSPQKIADRLGFKSDVIVSAIIKRKSLTGCIVYKGIEYPGQHEAIISLDRWKEAQEIMAQRSTVRGDNNYLLSGLIYCGECGAKMRYQKWNKSGECKIFCYSLQKSRPALVKDNNCPSIRLWQSELESAVINELFEMTYLVNKNNQKMNAFVDPTETIKSQLTAQKRKLSKLFDFDDGEDDDVLTEKILECKRKIRELESQLRNEEEQKELVKKIDKARQMLNTIQSSWDDLSQSERQTILQDLIDKIVVYKDGTINVYLKLQTYLINGCLI